MSSIPDSALQRDARQRALVPPERLAACQAEVIGVGAIGRQVALQLAALGVPDLTLYDPDTVAVENLAPQGYWAADVGMAKVVATAELCHQINPDLHLRAIPERFRRSSVPPVPGHRRQVVFACVDSIATRRLVWQALRNQAALFLDGRMSAEVVRVVTSPHPATDTAYPTSLFAAEEAYAGACTARSTIYAASIAAGLMVGQFTKWLRDLPLEPDVLLNLLAMELTTPTDKTS
jgi:sulfur carrier protein ThiS adenylyltransferase